MKKPIHYMLDYIALCLLFSTFVLMLINFSGVPLLQRLVVILTAITYVLWGYIHHKKEGTYNIKNMLEYFAFSVLGSVLVIGLI